MVLNINFREVFFLVKLLLMNTYIHTHIHTYIHTYIHTWIYVSSVYFCYIHVEIHYKHTEVSLTVPTKKPSKTLKYSGENLNIFCLVINKYLLYVFKVKFFLLILLNTYKLFNLFLASAPSPNNNCHTYLNILF